ncbi:gp75 [Sphingomonas phage PAU]|uniref:gp75 n=1 Tax=Sphingomonas phage PAU TaxID=1150991 RepID=UPI00025731D5|nr:gp75 [Sphingomonas phage PAU]AFF28073.1 gp75 [Sphingomonas phage PAU]
MLNMEETKLLFGSYASSRISVFEDDEKLELKLIHENEEYVLANPSQFKNIIEVIQSAILNISRIDKLKHLIVYAGEMLDFNLYIHHDYVLVSSDVVNIQIIKLEYNYLNILDTFNEILFYKK